MIDLDIDGVSAASTRIFTAAGMPGDMAEQLTVWLVSSNLSGHPSHGLQRVTEYVRQIQDGTMDPAARPRVHLETDTTVVLDGQAGPGHFAADRLTRELAVKCRNSQIAMGGIINGRHIGRLGEWGELAADLGVLLYISLGSASGSMAATFGAAEGRLGTNPIAFGAPGLDDDSFVMDFATSAAAEGKIRVARDSGKSVPKSWIRDSDGRPTTDPNDFYEGGTMLTFGEHKGSAIAIMTTLFSVVTASAGEDIGEGASVFAFAIDPNAFGRGEETRKLIQHQLDRVRSAAPAEGFSDVQVPGDFERRSRAALAGGPLQIPEPTWEGMLQAADRVEVSRAEIEALALA
ncbi:MAG: Ldh family oxidoreductase [Chloroflexi bacterium]|nr:Ldh family oxidoreductase [Chloroflexota bacterium]